MTEPFTKDDAEVIFRQLNALLPEGINAVLILAGPVPDKPGAACLHCLATVPPDMAYSAMGNLLLRRMKGEAQTEILRPIQ